MLAHFLADNETGSRLLSDFLTKREFHRLGLYGDFFAHVGVEDQLTVLVSPVRSGLGVGISVDRGRRSFELSDRRRLDSLRPHLAVARANAARFSRALALGSGEAQAAASVLERLTDRQREILAHVASGATNAQVALELDLSVGTVRKHLEHILRRLGVATRTAAAACFLTASGSDAPPWWTASEEAMLASPSA